MNWEARRYDTAPLDMTGKYFQVGVWVLKPMKRGNSPLIERRMVIKIEDGRVYLDGTKLVALRYPGRCYIL